MRFGLSAIIASLVVVGMLILGAMFQDEYEQGFVRIMSFTVRLATPEELAQAEAQGSPPPPLAVARPDTPLLLTTDPLVAPDELTGADELLPLGETLAPFEGLEIQSPPLELPDPPATED